VRTKIDARVKRPQVVRGRAHVQHAALHGQTQGLTQQVGGREGAELEGPFEEVCVMAVVAKGVGRVF
jgi:hypothetical protein